MKAVSIGMYFVSKPTRSSILFSRTFGGQIKTTLILFHQINSNSLFYYIALCMLIFKYVYTVEYSSILIFCLHRFVIDNLDFCNFAVYEDNQFPISLADRLIYRCKLLEGHLNQNRRKLV